VRVGRCGWEWRGRLGGLRAQTKIQRGNDINHPIAKHTWSDILDGWVMVQGVWVWGIIDQLEMCDSEAASVRVVEQKTRFQPSMPGYCQKRTTAVQTMIYRQAAYLKEQM
jgi:hypothetical protein